MDIQLEPGTYVVAVSGGVDSMALLHALRSQPGMDLTVAHFDHGIRKDSHEDRRLVQRTAKTYGLPFEYAAGMLGPGTSEDAARKARYAFLEEVRRKHDAQAIITAHHKDDVLETAIINMLRGTGRKGLASIRSIDGIRRPLLHHTKAEIRRYAADHSLEWREDSTNDDTAYLRNHVRHGLLTRFDPAAKELLHRRIQHMKVINGAIDELLEEYLQRYSYHNRLKRHEFIMLPHLVAREVMAAWLRRNGIRSFDKKMLERMTHAAKIYTVGRVIPINNSTSLIVNAGFLALEHVER